MKKLRNLAKSALIIMILTLFTKFLGFLREALIASTFGASMETDTFFIAITATSLVTVFITKAISTTFIPVISEIESNEGMEGKIEHTNNIINVIFIISIILVIGGYGATTFIIRLVARGFTGEQFTLAVKLTRIGLPMILFGGIIGVFTGYLESEEKFIFSSLTRVPINLFYIFFLLFLSNELGIEGLMVFAVIGMASQFLILILGAKCSGYKYMFIFDLKNKYIKKIISLSFPIFIGVAIDDINVIIDRTLASNLVSGSISALNYADKLKELILGVFVAAITTVIFPLLSRKANNDNINEFKKIMDYGINIILIIIVPATVGLIVLSTPIVEIAFQRGQFNPRATIMTSQALMFYSIGLISMAIKSLLNMVYYSLQDTRTPMINAGISVAFNIVLNLILIKYMDHSGLALATSISTTITMLLLLFGLEKKIGPIGIKEYINTFLKIGLASGIMGLVSYLTYHGIFEKIGSWKSGNLISLLIAVGIGALLYGVLSYILGIIEIRSLVKEIKVRLKKNN